MNRFCSIFSQVLNLLPRLEFARAVTATKAERHARGFPCWTQFVSLLFCQLGRAHSLREICHGLASCEGKLVHLGVHQGARKRSTLAYADEHRPWRLYQRVFFDLLARCRSLPQAKKKFRFRNQLLSLDSSVVDLCLSMFDWAKFRHTKGAIKVRGLAKNTAYEVMRVNVHVSRAEAPPAGLGAGCSVDTFDLYSAQRRGGFIKRAADELVLKEDVIKKDLGKVLMKLEELQDEQIRRALEPAEGKTVTLTQEEQASALDLLKDRKLLDRILADFERCWVVGGATNKLVGYLAAISRKLERPLAVTIQSSSSAGATSLMEAIRSFTPDEERVRYSAMTGQSLFCMGETDLRHKILAVVQEAGAECATYALKFLQSEGELSIASTGKDPTTGKLITHEYHVEGPVMILFTTTAVDPDEDMQDRCIPLAVDEGREQTRAIHCLQREEETLQGRRLRHRGAESLALHRNAQRLLKPILVINPYAPRLAFTDTEIRTRRDHMKYLTLIRTIALLHQYRRPVLTDGTVSPPEPYIEVTREDVAVANRLAAQIFDRSLDELSLQTRHFLLLPHRQMVSEACKRLEMEQSDYRFGRKEVRAATGWSDFQVRTHLDKLVSLGYVLVHAAAAARASFTSWFAMARGRKGSRL